MGPRNLHNFDLDLDIDLEGGETLALAIKCPNETCAALPGEPCLPYTHWVRVRDALFALPRPVDRNV